MEQKGKKNNKKTKLPKFNFYWIYGIVAVVLISINLINPSNSWVIKTNYSDFKQFIENKQVKEVIVVNKKEARVYIYPEQLSQSPHNNKGIPQKSVFGGTNNGPHYYFNIPNNEQFASFIEESNISYDYIEEDDFFYSYRSPFLVSCLLRKLCSRTLFKSYKRGV